MRDIGRIVAFLAVAAAPALAGCVRSEEGLADTGAWTVEEAALAETAAAPLEQPDPGPGMRPGQLPGPVPGRRPGPFPGPHPGPFMGPRPGPHPGPFLGPHLELFPDPGLGPRPAPVAPPAPHPAPTQSAAGAFRVFGDLGIVWVPHGWQLFEF